MKIVLILCIIVSAQIKANQPRLQFTKVDKLVMS